MGTDFVIHSLPPLLRHEGWGRLLNIWARLMRKYTNLESTDGEKDVPYWYGERALTGLLAAAAWMLPGGWSLEEFTGQRGSGRRVRSGRGDLWIGIGRANYTIEAKVAWPSIARKGEVPYVRAQLSDGEKQLQNLEPKYREGKGIAICYVVPSLRADKMNGNKERIARHFAKMCGDLKGTGSIVAAYRDNGVLLKHENYIYPGVILVGNVVAWGRT